MKSKLIIDWDAKEAFLKEIGNPVSPHLVFEITVSGAILKGKITMFLLPDDRTAVIAVTPTDAKGFEAPVESLSFTSSDETIVTVDAAGLITPVGIGSAIINVTADADLGDGVVTIAGMLDVQVLPGQAVNLAVTANLV